MITEEQAGQVEPLCCAIFGGSGFIGSHLVDALLNFGYQVKVLSRSHSAVNLSNKENLKIVTGDISNEESVVSVLADCNVCFYLVSTVLPKSSNLNPVFDIESNLVNFIKLLDYAIKQKVKKIIFLSSGGTVYGSSTVDLIDECHPTNPLCSYGVVKLAIEKYLFMYQQLYGLDYSVLRIANVYGERQRLDSGQGAIAVFLQKALCNEKIEIWGDGSVVRDYVYVSDVVDAMIAAMGHKGSERVFNIGSGEGTSLNALLDEIELITGNKLVKHYSGERKFDVQKNVLSIELAKKTLSWHPRVTLAEGLLHTATWLRSIILQPT